VEGTFQARHGPPPSDLTMLNRASTLLKSSACAYDRSRRTSRTGSGSRSTSSEFQPRRRRDRRTDREWGRLPAKYPKAVPTMSLEEPMGLSALQLTTLVSPRHPQPMICADPRECSINPWELLRLPSSVERCSTSCAPSQRLSSPTGTRRLNVEVPRVWENNVGNAARRRRRWVPRDLLPRTLY
jgi:hypothetical protein